MPRHLGARSLAPRRGAEVQPLRRLARRQDPQAVKRVQVTEGMFTGKVYVLTPIELDRVVHQETRALRAELRQLQTLVEKLRAQDGPWLRASNYWTPVANMSAAQLERRRKSWRESKQRAKARRGVGT